MIKANRFRFVAAMTFIAGLTLLCSAHAALLAQDKKEGGKDEPKVKKGKLMGVVVAKTKNSIKVKAFGEEKEREYFPHWVGGLPKDGGGPDKKMLATFEKLKVGQKIRLTWEWEERFRAVEVEILDKDDKTPPPKN